MSEKKTINIHFIGNDQGYWFTLQERIKELYPTIQKQFSAFTDKNKFNPQVTYAEIMNLEVDILFIDFSFDEKKCYRLLKFITRDNLGKLISTTALHNYLAKPDDIRKALFAGARLNQIKSAEISTVIYHAMYLHNPKIAKKPQSATAKMEHEHFLGQDLRLAYATKDRYRVETNSPLVEGTDIVVGKHVLDNIFKSDRFIVGKIKDTDLYYNYRYGVYLKYCMHPSLEPGYDVTKDVDEEGNEITLDKNQVAELKGENEYQIKKIQKELNQWVDNNADRVVPKWTKVLIIQKGLGFLRDMDKGIDEYPYSFNVQQTCVPDMVQVQRTKPHIITFCMEDTPVSEDGKPVDIWEYNGLDMLSAMISATKSINGYYPIIVIFGCSYSASSLQEKFQYPKLMTYQDKVSFDIIINFANMYERQTMAKVEAKEKRVYFGGSDLGSIVNYKRDITIIAMNEFEIIFFCQTEIPFFTVFNNDYPVNMQVTVVPMQEGNKYEKESNHYMGLINCIGETDKQKLRQLINQIFTAEKEAKEKAEKEQFEELNKKALEEKQKIDGEDDPDENSEG